jgi:hypothetical protein
MDVVAATEEFYDWELRGRGWTVWDYPVALEPPFRPFLFHGSAVRPSFVDDGRHETALSAFAGRLKKLLRKPPQAAPVLDPHAFLEDDAPAAAPTRDALRELALLPPSDYATKREVTDRLLIAFASSTEPIAFEIVGTANRIQAQLVCREQDHALVQSQLAAYAPAVLVDEGHEPLANQWTRSGEAALIVDFGLANEFMLPLAAADRFDVDPLVSVAGSLAGLREGELALLQVLFAPARNPWAESIVRAVSDGAGGCFFADAPEVLTLAREKISEPLFAVGIRVAARASDRLRAYEIARSVGAALLQFSRPRSNEFVPLEAHHYPPDVHEEDLLTRSSHRSGMLLSLPELRSLVHIPDASVRTDNLRRFEKKTKATPLEAIGHSLVLGENLHRGERQAVSLSIEQRLKHVHVIGASGTGKSTLLVSIALQAIAAGEGVGVLDPHGDLVDEILGRLPENRTSDVVVFDPSDPAYSVGFNVLRARSEIEKEILASDLVAVFRRLSTSWGDQMTAVLGNAISAFLEHPEGGTLSELRRFLADAQYRRAFLANVTDPEVRRFWEDTFPLLSGSPQASILTRLNSFLRPRSLRGVIAQDRSALDLGAIMSEGKVFLGKLAQGLIGTENAHFLGSLLVTKFHQVALARQALPPTERRPFTLVIDEFQSFATPSMAEVLSGARKFGLGLALVHQELGQLASSPQVKNALLGNAYTRIVFRVGDEDARVLAGGFATFDAGDLSSLATGEALCRIGQARHDFSFCTHSLPTVQANEAAARTQEVIAASRATYAVPRVDLEDQTAEDAVVVPNVRTTEPPPPIKKSTPPPTPADPLIETPGPGRGGKEHKYLQHLVRQLAEQRGFRASLEEELPDKSGRVDVVLRRDLISIACEISITTTPDHEVENVRKCLRAGFRQVVAMASDQRRLGRLKAAVEKAVTPEEVSLVAFLVPDEIVEYLDAHVEPTTETVRGYSVRVTRRSITTDDAEARRAAIGRVIARSMKRLD